MERLPEQVESGAVFPTQALDADIVRRHPGPPDAPVCVPHQSDGGPTIDVCARPGVGLLTLCYEAAGYPILGSRRLHTKKLAHQRRRQRAKYFYVAGGMTPSISSYSPVLTPEEQ